MTTPKLIIFTDLDGTLLDRDTYSFEAAIPVLRVLKQNAIPLVLTSSKTRAEIELYRKKLENHHPFISENGGAIFVPKGYFSFQFPCDRGSEGYLVLELGTFYPLIIGVLNSIKKETGIRIRAFSDLTEEELTSLCGLSLREAEFAKKREYDEPFMIEGGKREVEMVKEKIEEKGMNYVWGGRFHHIFGKNDKGKAVEILKELYENEFFSISTVGVGNSLNDLPMLLAVDHPVFLKGREDHPLEIPLKIQNLTILDGTGPFVWKEALLSLLKKVKI
jgi:mannosyl-3-phosphoglycerate phosphatase